jgi:hypothetical protein
MKKQRVNVRHPTELNEVAHISHISDHHNLNKVNIKVWNRFESQIILKY